MLQNRTEVTHESSSYLCKINFRSWAATYASLKKIYVALFENGLSTFRVLISRSFAVSTKLAPARCPNLAKIIFVLLGYGLSSYVIFRLFRLFSSDTQLLQNEISFGNP
jgi:hypothetical protein